DRLCGNAAGSADILEDQFTKFVPVSVIKRNLGELERELKEAAAALKKAEAVDKEIEKTLSGEKNPLDDLGKAAKALEQPLKKAAGLKALAGRSDNYKKLLAKVEDKQAADLEQIDLLKDNIKAANDAEQDLGELIIALP